MASCILNLGIRWELASLRDRLNSAGSLDTQLGLTPGLDAVEQREMFDPAGVEGLFADCSAPSLVTILTEQ